MDSLGLRSRPPISELQLGDRKVPINIKVTTKDEVQTIVLLAHDQEIESETYHLNDKEMAVMMVAGETYEPALPILRLPMRIGESWKWKGTLTAGDLNHTGNAVVSSSSELIFAPQSSQALRINVDLLVDVGNTPSQRQLTFWFVPKRGLVQRSFGASMRTPVR